LGDYLEMAAGDMTVVSRPRVGGTVRPWLVFRLSTGQRVCRECRVEQDHRLGLVAEEADLEFIEESVGIRAGTTMSEPVDPAARLLAMPEAQMGHR
jgi:hypothetical protein